MATAKLTELADELLEAQETYDRKVRDKAYYERMLSTMDQQIEDAKAVRDAARAALLEVMG